MAMSGISHEKPLVPYFSNMDNPIWYEWNDPIWSPKCCSPRQHKKIQLSFVPDMVPMVMKTLPRAEKISEYAENDPER